MGDLNPVLVAVSDLLVLTALERAASRARLPHAARMNPYTRHRAYLEAPIPTDRIDAAMKDAWVLVPLIAARQDLDVNPADWIDLLNSYTRALILMGVPHSMSRLTPHLAPLAAAGATLPEGVITCAI